MEKYKIHYLVGRSLKKSYFYKIDIDFKDVSFQLKLS
jgi:hypothetical protein